MTNRIWTLDRAKTRVLFMHIYLLVPLRPSLQIAVSEGVPM